PRDHAPRPRRRGRTPPRLHRPRTHVPRRHLLAAPQPGGPIHRLQGDLHPLSARPPRSPLMAVSGAPPTPGLSYQGTRSMPKTIFRLRPAAALLTLLLVANATAAR